MNQSSAAPIRPFDRFVHALPRTRVTRALGALAERKVPRVARGALYGLFARAVGVDATEQAGTYQDYATFGDYFARPLRDGLRTWGGDPDILGSPCDGELASLGPINADRLPQVKGQTYSLTEFLGESALAERYANGSQVTIYLSPKDYHRVHVPFDAKVTRIDRRGAELWPVRPDFLARRPSVFVENERVLFHLEDGAGRHACLVMVGATVVGSVAVRSSVQPPYDLAQGDELGAFRLGSTIVLLLDERFGLNQDAPTSRPERKVRLGGRVASLSLS